jgi:hypothetical protein
VQRRHRKGPTQTRRYQPLLLFVEGEAQAPEAGMGMIMSTGPTVIISAVLISSGRTELAATEHSPRAEVHEELERHAPFRGSVTYHSR